MSVVIEQFVTKVRNAKKQHSSRLILSMDEAQGLSVEIARLERAVEILSEAPPVVEVPSDETAADGGSF